MLILVCAEFVWLSLVLRSSLSDCPVRKSSFLPHLVLSVYSSALSCGGVYDRVPVWLLSLSGWIQGAGDWLDKWLFFFLNSFLRYNLHTLKFTCFKNTVQLLPVTENLKSPVFLLYSRTSTIRHTSDTRVVSHSPPVLILPTWREHQTPQVWGLVLQGCPPCL